MNALYTYLLRLRKMRDTLKNDLTDYEKRKTDLIVQLENLELQMNCFINIEEQISDIEDHFEQNQVTE
jgi:hypothetical protein